MSKRSRSPNEASPPPKRLHLQSGPALSGTNASFQSLSDEVVMHVFRNLGWVDLCMIQRASTTWSRLALDSQLWKRLYWRHHGTNTLQNRGPFQDLARSGQRDIKPLPRRSRGALTQVNDRIDWKLYFRIAHNWSRGRCSVEDCEDAIAPHPHDNSNVTIAGPSPILLIGRLLIKAHPWMASFDIHHPILGTHSIPCPSTRLGKDVTTTALVADQSGSTYDNSTRMALFLSTGEYSIFNVNHAAPRDSAQIRRYVPRIQNSRNSSIRTAVYHHPLLITLSEAFRLTIFDVSQDRPRITETLSSFSSFPPSSMHLTPTGPNAYQLVLAYTVTVYPEHYSLGTTQLLIRDFTVTSSRTTRACEIPFGFVTAAVEQTIREQWSRRVASVADTATDGKWVILGPKAIASASPNPLQLYRLHLPTGTGARATLTFVRYLHGLKGSVSVLKLAHGRCICVGVDESMRIWDLEHDTTAEISPARFDMNSSGDVSIRPRPLYSVDSDDRKIVTRGGSMLQIRHFDI